MCVSACMCICKKGDGGGGGGGTHKAVIDIWTKGKRGGAKGTEQEEEGV